MTITVNYQPRPSVKELSMFQQLFEYCSSHNIVMGEGPGQVIFSGTDENPDLQSIKKHLEAVWRSI